MVLKLKCFLSAHHSSALVCTSRLVHTSPLAGSTAKDSHSIQVRVSRITATTQDIWTQLTAYEQTVWRSAAVLHCFPASPGVSGNVVGDSVFPRFARECPKKKKNSLSEGLSPLAPFCCRGVTQVQPAASSARYRTSLSNCTAIVFASRYRSICKTTSLICDHLEWALLWWLSLRLPSTGPGRAMKLDLVSFLRSLGNGQATLRDLHPVAGHFQVFRGTKMDHMQPIHEVRQEVGRRGFCVGGGGCCLRTKIAEEMWSPPKHHGDRCLACGLVGWCSVGRQEGGSLSLLSLWCVKMIFLNCSLTVFTCPSITSSYWRWKGTVRFLPVSGCWDASCISRDSNFLPWLLCSPLGALTRQKKFFTRVSATLGKEWPKLSASPWWVLRCLRG
jgi:hypothetical protein